MQGCGKTTLLKYVKERFGDNNLEIVHGSEVIFNISNKVFGAEWSQLNEFKRREVREYAVRQILAQTESKKIIIIDGHYIEMLDGQIYEILPEELKKNIKYHVIVEAPVELVQARRISDLSKSRDIDIDLIKREMKAEREVAQKTAWESNSRVQVVENLDLDKAANTFIDLLRTI